MLATPGGPGDFFTNFDEGPIVWAVDAFPDGPSKQQQLHAHAAEMLAATFPRSPIFPVYVLSEVAFANQGFSGFLKPALKPMARKSLDRILSEFGEPSNMHKPRVLVERSASLANSAIKLGRFAQKIGAKLIAVSSHGRRGFARYFMGSFSETVVNKSGIPVLVAGPHLVHVHDRPVHVVFPTDFDPSCRTAYRTILNLANWLGAELHLVHTNETEVFAGGWLTEGALLGQIQPMADAMEAEDWLDEAAESGVRTRLIFDNLREPASEAIVEYVKNLGEASALLALHPRFGPLATSLFGSLTRDVIRSSPSPIYVAPRA